MGIEPFVEALRSGVKRSLPAGSADRSMFAAPPILNGFDHSSAIHMGKILECGAIASEPGSGSDVMLGTLTKDHFVVKLMNPALEMHREVCCCVTACMKCRIHGTCANRAASSSSTRLRPGWKRTEREGCRQRVQGGRASIVLSSKAQNLSEYRTICVAGTRDPEVIGVSRRDPRPGAATSLPSSLKPLASRRAVAAFPFRAVQKPQITLKRAINGAAPGDTMCSEPSSMYH